MLNKEKYKDELEKVLARGLAVLKSGEICRCRDLKYCDECIFFGGICVNSAMDWLNSECKEPVLTDEEKEYLRAVIEPFRKSVISIKKLEATYGWEIISFYYTFQSYGCITILPPFQSGTRFKGMELGKEYTCEELEVICEL